MYQVGTINETIYLFKTKQYYNCINENRDKGKHKVQLWTGEGSK